MRKEFYSNIAEIYRSLRVTDSEPVLYIKPYLEGKELIEAADVGAGAGRYAKLFFEHFGEDRLYLHCIDTNEYMLKSLQDYLLENNISNFRTAIAAAEEMPVATGELDCIFCFNSIHQFNFYRFFKEADRALKRDGMIFIYSRTRTQNEQSIWGRFFPLFRKKESRLFEPDEFSFTVDNIPEFEIVETKVFNFPRNNTVKELVDRASSRHYSAFFLYEEEEFETALKKFEANLIENFPDPGHVKWDDGKIMYILKKAS